MKCMTLCVLLLLGLAVLAVPFLAGAVDRPYSETPTRDGDLQSNLSILNLWGEQPSYIQDIYTAAYRVLETRPHAAFAEVWEDETFQQLCNAHDVLHLGGPMLGNVTGHGVDVWLRTSRPATVEVRVTVGQQERVFGPVESTDETDLTAVVPVAGLLPDTRYPYRVLVDGVPIALPEHAAMVTAPSDTIDGQVRIAFGSCFHRWGLGNTTQSDMIRRRRPSAMVLMGDIAAQDRNNHTGMHRADYLMRDLIPAWQQLVASVPVYATWDDHDYFDNDLAGIPEGFTGADRSAVRQVWRENWNNPQYGFDDDRGGVFLRTRVGPADIIMVDNRYFREQGSFLGAAQTAWLKEQLLDCEGPFIILSCGTMWNDYVSDAKDSWGRYDPEGRESIFRLIEDNNIGGVLLISGDRHGARGFRIPRSDAFSFYEFGVASLGGRRGPTVTKEEWNTQLYGIEDRYAFGEFDIDATKDDPEVTFRLIQAEGPILYEITLQHSTLTPGN